MSPVVTNAHWVALPNSVHVAVTGAGLAATAACAVASPAPTISATARVRCVPLTLHPHFHETFVALNDIQLRRGPGHQRWRTRRQTGRAVGRLEGTPGPSLWSKLQPDVPA